MNPVEATLVAILSLGVAAASADEHAAHHAHAPAPDGRVTLQLTPDERAVVLEEMRLFLAGVQKMTGALARQDMPATAAAARDLGQKMVHELPPALRAKLPAEFRQLGASVHRDFDQIAMDAESMKDVSTTLHQLSATMQKCVSCHATYQIASPAPDARH